MAWTRDQMAERAAHELRDGYYVNLGIGIPTLVSNFIPPGMSVQLQSENGMLGTGPFPFEGEEDPDLINAGKQPVMLLRGGCYFHHGDSFAMMRGGHLDICVLGAFQVSAGGDLAGVRKRLMHLYQERGRLDVSVDAGKRRAVMEIPL